MTADTGQGPAAAPAKPAADTAADLAKLFPEIKVPVQDPYTGEAVVLTFREFRFREGLEAAVVARPFIADLAALVAPKARGEVAPKARGEVAPKARGEVAPKARGDGEPKARGGEPEGDDAGALPGVEVFDDLIAAHADLWLELSARACGREAAWIARLIDEDAVRVRDAMWAANGPFFTRRLVRRIEGRGAAVERLFRSIVSSIRSSGPDTGAATTT